ncbi:MAG: tetratricopeptide repeat protein [Myxococcaceae bacterium]
MRVHLPGRVYAALGATAVVGTLALALTYPNDRLVGAMFETDGELETAVRFYRSWTAKYPKDYEARRHTADLLLQAASPAEAIAVLEEMARDWPDRVELIERLVEVEESLLRMEAVLPRLESLARLKPDDPKTLRKLADHYRWFGKTEPLVKTLLHLVHVAEAPDERSEVVDILLANRRYDELIAFVLEEVKAKPDQVEPRLALYEAYLRSDRTELAFEQLRQVMLLDPRSLEHLQEYGEQLVKLGRIEEAIKAFEARLSTDPTNPALRKELGDLYDEWAVQLKAQGKLDELLRLFRKRIADDPTNLELRLEFADLHGKRATEVAVAELREVAKLLPRSVEVWLAIGERLGWLGRMGEAVQAIEKAKDLKPESAEVRRALARHLDWAGRGPEALTLFREVIALNPTVEDRATFTDLLLDAGLEEEALAQAQALVKSAPAVIAHQEVLARTALAMDDCQTAIVPLRVLSRVRSQELSVWSQRGICAKKLGYDEEAVQALGEVIRLRRTPRVSKGGG